MVEDSFAKQAKRTHFFAIYHKCGNLGLASALQTKRAGFVANDGDDFRLQPAISDSVEQILQARTAAAEKDGKA
jgi:hypothetical protein